MTHWIDLPTPHGPVRAWHALPEAGAPARPGVVLVQEIFGVNAHIRDVAARLAAAGHEVLAPSVCDPVEVAVELGYDGEGIARGRELVAALGFDRAVEIVDAAAGSLRASGRGVSAMGFCWGGTVALLAAMRLGLPAVSYYGARNAPFLSETPLAPVMFHFGEQDASIPPKLVQQHRDLLPQMDVFTYPAGHGFNCDLRADYDPSSARLARERTLDFLARNLA